MTSTSAPSIDFTAIDVETANSSRASVCAVGLTKVRDGQVVETASWLVAPPEGHDVFLPRNVAIHRITAELVADAPSWNAVFPQMMEFVGADALVAHNAPFDRSVVHQACSAYDLDWPESTWIDTLSFARRMLTLGSYSLPFVAQALGLAETVHHEASEDALQAAQILIALCAKAGVSTLAELHAGTQIGARTPRTGSSAGPARATGDFSGLVATDVLAGEKVVFTGTLMLSSRAEAQALVTHFGGTAQAGVTKATTILVSGELDPSSLRPGVELSRKLEKAMLLAAGGQTIEIWTEDDFHRRLDVGRDELEAATREQRVLSNPGWLPSYVIDQARALDGASTYQAWLRAALRHPAGRASGDDMCIRCGGVFEDDVYWMLLERRVCSGDCNEALKRKAKNEWSKLGIARPEAPAYLESYGRR